MTRLRFATLAFVCVASPALAQAPAPATPTPAIVTQGEAILKRAPDRAWLTIATEARASRAADARQQNAAAMTAVQNTLEGAGVPSGALRTTGFSVSPEFDWNDGRSTLRGYVARNQIEVRVDDLDRLPAVLDAVNTPREVALSITGPRFDLKDEQAARNDALRAAVEDGLGRAKVLAAAASRTLGPVLRVEEHNVGSAPPPRPYAMRASVAEDAATPITPGEIEVRAHVTLTVEIR